MGLDVFFATPPLSLVDEPEGPRLVQPHHRTYDMPKVRCSTRLAKKPAIPAMKKTQINLCRQLGLIDDERKPIEQVLIDYITMYRGPLPPQVIDALSTFFGIHDELTTQLDEVMMQLAGVRIDDINAGGFADDVV